MPPSWQLSPARSRKDHSLQSQRWCCRRAILYRHDDGAAAVLKSSPEIKNRCSPEAILEFFLASIPKSGREIKNRCTKDGISRQNHASIPKSGPEITNQCSRGIAAVCRRNHSSLQKRKIESDAKYAAATAAAGGPFFFAATKIRIGRGKSLPQRQGLRLQLHTPQRAVRRRPSRVHYERSGELLKKVKKSLDSYPRGEYNFAADITKLSYDELQKQVENRRVLPTYAGYGQDFTPL